jgi:methylthioribose-1-phosphate isomerase
MKTVPSPLFEPVFWKDGGFEILNELALPDKIEYIKIHQIADAIGAVRDMKTRAFGQVLTYLFSAALLAQKFHGTEPDALRQELGLMTQQFSDARPTFDFKGIGEFFSAWFKEATPGINVGELISERARGFAGQIIKARLARAQRAATILPDCARVMTHCNVSGELVAIGQFCKEMGKEFSVIATETRPYLQGSRLTAWELSRSGVSVSVIPDCATAQVMSKGSVNAVIVGADRCAQNGDIINKVGTYPLAIMAREYGIPFYALVQDPGSLVSGDDVKIEERSIDELLEFEGRPLVSEGGDKLAGRYPAFDVTPAHLISRFIGFEDLFTLESFRAKFLKRSIESAADAKSSQGNYLLVFGVPSQNTYSFLAHALKAEQADRILVPEMRPELFGARIVARELLRRDIPVTLISDNMMGILFTHGEVRKLYLFYSGLTERGPQSICGSLLAVQLARAHGVPIELQEHERNIEPLPDSDVASFLGQRIITEGISVYPVEQETVPWELFKNDRGASI